MTLEGARLSFGRAIDNQLSFPEDDGLSRHHFTLEQCGEDWGIEDLKSKNGTFVNGERLAGQRVLVPGDRITASSVTLVFGDHSPDRTVLFESPAAHASVTASTDLASLLAREAAQAAPLWNAPPRRLSCGPDANWLFAARWPNSSR